MSLYHWTWAKNVISCHIIASHSNDWCIVTCMQIRVPIWSYFYHQVEIIIWAFAPCIARIVHWKLWLISPPKQKLCGIMSIVQNKKCRNCKLLTFVGFCVFLRIICVLLRFFFAYILFVVWSIWGSKHCNVYNTTEKLHVFLSLGAGRWDHAWIVGRMSRNNIFCVCICSKKLQNMLVSLIHGTEFIDLTLNVVPQAILITHV